MVLCSDGLSWFVVACDVVRDVCRRVRVCDDGWRCVMLCVDV